MPTLPPTRTHHAAPPAIALALRLLRQILAIGLRGLFFAGAHRGLPPAIRLRSPGFLACSVLFFVAAWLRHGLAGHEPATQVLLGAGLVYAVLMLISLAQRMADFTLCLCISIAIDLLATALALVGAVTPADTLARDLLLAWPLSAILVALVQMRLADPVPATSPADWPTHPRAPSQD